MDSGGEGPPVLLLHGLAGSFRELLPTAHALADRFRVLLIDQRGHGRSTRRPADLRREAFVGDVVAVVEGVLHGQPVRLVGQSMGAHTAFLTAATRPDLVDRLVLLEGHVAGDDRPEEARKLGDYFASWPTPFADVDTARAFLGTSPLADAWIDDLRATARGLYPRFDPDVMRTAIAAVHAPRWTEWENLATPTLVVFAEHGMFTDEEKDELVRRRPGTRRADIPGASHDAHLDGFDAWSEILRGYLDGDAETPSAAG
ncbi:alpha/beta hydrolase [Promicromonospora sp. NPDC023805]|uniref:alpha/beta fold hydrolase n=1 Tax=Promicromonospora sp. NPDC023805 TaxID=3154696 RepID=UPI0033EEEEE5